MTPEALIGTNVKIALKDNRVLDGVITVVDPFGNILLSNVWESSNDKIDPETLHTRELGLKSGILTSHPVLLILLRIKMLVPTEFTDLLMAITWPTTLVLSR